MKIYEIKNLNYSDEEQREKLIKATMKALKLDEVPDEIYLRKTVEKLQKKYGYKIKTVVTYNTHFIANIKVSKDGYSSLIVSDYYEFLCKYILFVKAQLKLERKANE